MQSISKELGTKTGQEVHLSLTGKVILTIQFTDFDGKNNGIVPHQPKIFDALFFVHYRQRGGGFGALASGICRIALALARKFITTAAKRVGKCTRVRGCGQQKIRKAGAEKHYFENSHRASRRLLSEWEWQNWKNRRWSKHSGSKARKSTIMRKALISKNSPKQVGWISLLEVKKIGNVLPTKCYCTGFISKTSASCNFWW